MSQVSAGSCQLLPQPTREQCSALCAGPRLMWPMVPTMLAPFRGRNRTKAAVVLGGAVLGWRRRLQTWPYRVTGLLWAQHGFGRGSGNNTTSNNWQEHNRGPFQGHGRSALFLLHLGAGQTDLAGDGDSSPALLRLLHDRHGPLHHSHILCGGGEAIQEDSWLERRQSRGHNGSSIQC